MKNVSKINVVEPIRSKSDIQKIIDWFNNTDRHKYAVLFTLGVNSGLRISDILSLKVKDVYKKSHISLREQKTNKFKNFPIKPELQDTLNSFCKGRKPDEWLFTSRHNTQLDRTQVWRFINMACEDLRIEANVGTHTMRKTFGYHHYKQFHDIALLQTIFNHYSPQVTKRYIGITQDEINSSYLSLNLKENQDLIEEAILCSKIKARRVESYVKNYLKNGCKLHKDFALDILYILNQHC